MKWFYAIFTLLFIAFAGFLIWNTLPQPVKDCIVKINVVEAKDANIERVVEISERTLKDTLQQAAYAARQEAQAEYDKNFSTLLAILTVFGIAWPLMVAFVQYKFNERKIDKIENAKKDAKKALNDAQIATEQAEQSIKISQDLSVQTKEIQSEMYYNFYRQNKEHGDLSFSINKSIPDRNFFCLMSLYCLFQSYYLDHKRISRDEVVGLLKRIVYSESNYKHLLPALGGVISLAKKINDEEKSTQMTETISAMKEKYKELGGSDLED